MADTSQQYEAMTKQAPIKQSSGEASPSFDPMSASSTLAVDDAAHGQTAESVSLGSPASVSSVVAKVRRGTGGLNVRAGPGPGFSIVNRLSEGEAVEAIAQNPDGSWYQITDGQVRGWIAAQYAEVSGDLKSLHTVAPPGAETTEAVHYAPPFAVSDRPIGVDRLGFGDFANAFTALLRNPATQPPLTIGIYAAWGMGKSFLMRMIKEAFENNPPSDAPEFVIATFNAWEYSGSENLWAGMVSRIYEAVEKRLGIKATTAFRLGKNRRKQVGQIPLRLVISVFIAVILALLANLDQITKLWTTVLGASSILALLLGVGSALVNTFNLVSKATIERSQQFRQMAAKPDFRAKIGFMADVKSEIDFVTELLEQQNKDKPIRVVIFIDDLDRCSPAKAVEVLEAIMLLLSEDESPFYVFLGLDARVLVKAIEERYGKVLTDAGVSGYEYLDKIVQIPFTIPAASDNRIKDYLKALLPQPGEDKQTTVVDQSVHLSNEPPAPTEPQPEVVIKELSFTPEEEQAFDDFHPYITRNPRRAKRIVNTYRLTRLLAGRDRQTLPPERARQLIKWVIMTEQWPYRLGLIIDQRQNAEQLRSGVGLNPKDALTSLYDAVQPKIESAESQHLRQLDEDAELFESFLKSESTPITAGDIKEFAALTFNLNPAIGGEIRKMLAHAPAPPITSATLAQANPPETRKKQKSKAAVT